METALEIRRGQILRQKIETLRDEIARKRGQSGANDADLARLAKELRTLTTEYRRAVARLADQDYAKRRAEWRAENRAGLSPLILRACR